MTASRLARSVLASALSATLLVALTPAGAHADEPSVTPDFQIELPVMTLAVPTAAGTCTLSQGGSGSVGAAPPADVVQEGTTVSTTSCSAVEAPRVTAQTILIMSGILLPPKTTSGSIRVGSGTGPVLGSASHQSGIALLPNNFVFRYISTMTTNAGNTARICREVETDAAGLVVGNVFC